MYNKVVILQLSAKTCRLVMFLRKNDGELEVKTDGDFFDLPSSIETRCYSVQITHMLPLQMQFKNGTC